MSPLPAAKSKLRRQLRAERRALQPVQQRKHSEQLLHNFLRTQLVLRFRRIALYLPADGEIDTWPLINKLHSLGLQVGLPVLHKNSTGRLRMQFTGYTATTPLVRGHYDLLEPARSATAQYNFLPDVLLLPLVSFDGKGHRLGMGGGFYDRYTNELEAIKPALRIGLGHELQALPNGRHLPIEPWDVPLDGVITERRRLGFSMRGRLCLGHTIHTT